MLVLTNGKIESGVLKRENAKEIHLMTAEGKLVDAAATATAYLLDRPELRVWCL